MRHDACSFRPKISAPGHNMPHESHATCANCYKIITIKKVSKMEIPLDSTKNIGFHNVLVSKILIKFSHYGFRV